MADEVLTNFLSSLYGQSEGRASVWWRATPGSKAPYSKSKWFSWPDQSDDMADFIESISDKDVCVTTSLYSEDRRTPEFATVTSSIWMDSDTCNGSNYRVPPSWTVVSSSGRWQHHWSLLEEISAADASEIVHRISLAHNAQGADQSSWPANKIMRVPGAANTSHGFPTRVRAQTSGQVYYLSELQEAYEDVVLPERAVVRDIPQLDVEDLPHYGNTLAKLPSRVVELATDEVKDGQNRSTFRYKLLLELFRAGLSYEEVVSVAWHAPASRKWTDEDPRGIVGLQGEAIRAKIEAALPNADPAEAFADDVDDAVELALDKPVIILTEDERDRVAATPNPIAAYNEFARERLAHNNEQYDMLNAWFLLSLAYCDAGYLPSAEGRVPLNFYGGILGETTTGKSASFKLFRAVLTEFFYNDPEYDLGGNFSESALLKALHARSGKVSLGHRDEAHGVLKAWKDQDWTTGVRETIADIYEGTVPPILRSSKGESVVGTSEARFNLHLMGTNRAMIDQMNQEMFHSGFLPRFIWAIGKPRKITRESLLFREADEASLANDYDLEARNIAVGLRNHRNAVRDLYEGPAPIRMSEDANERLADAANSLLDQYKDSRLWVMVEPSILRWKNSVHKAAALLAIHDERTKIELADVLVALESGEVWFTNMLRVMSQISASDFGRACDEIERFVNGKGGRASARAVYRRFEGVPTNMMSNYLDSLAKQGRVKRKFIGPKGRQTEALITPASPLFQEED